MQKRPNFYLLLDLDPSVDDWGVIERRLTEKRRSWSRDRSMGNPKARRKAEQSLALVHEIEAILKDPERRAREASEARRLQAEERRERLAELDEALALILSQGTSLSAQQREQIFRQFGDLLSREEIELQLEHQQARTRKEKIDRVTAASIRKNLDSLGLGTLYDFLDLPQDSSPVELSHRAKEVYLESQRLGRTDAIASARNELAGLCRSVFRNTGEKLKYDSHLIADRLELFKPHLEILGADGAVGQAAMENLIELARQRGIPEENARSFFLEYAIQKGWKLFSSSPESSPVKALPSTRLTSLLDKNIRNVTSKSFGIFLIDRHGKERVSNLIQKDDPVPCEKSLKIRTHDESLRSMVLRCMENSQRTVYVNPSECREVGTAELAFSQPLPRGSQIEITFRLGPDGLLEIEGKDLTTGHEVEASFRTNSILTGKDLEEARERNLRITISPGQPRLKGTAPGRERTGSGRSQVFISYCHKDRPWLERLKVMLSPVVRNSALSVWDDTQVSAGARWRNEMERAIASARVAVLLVSQDFLNSEFILDNELPPLLKAAEEDGLKIIWVCLKTCLYEETAIDRFKAAHDPRKPLASFPRRADQDRVLAQVCRQIKGAFQARPSS